MLARVCLNVLKNYESQKAFFASVECVKNGLVANIFLIVELLSFLLSTD